MKRTKIGVVTVLLAITTLCIPALAEKKTLNPADRCSSVLRYESKVDKIMVGLWAFGYLSKSTGQVKVASPESNERILKFLARLCNKNPDLSFKNVVEKFAKLLTTPRKGSKDARSVIRPFMAANADYARLTRAILPTERDIRTVFAEPLASKLVTLYMNAMKSGIVIKPKPEHTDFISVQTTTGKLRNRDPVAEKFAGGLKKVAPYYLVDIPIARFKFVKAGENIGLIVESLYFINGRWVLLPKPWYALR